MRHQWPHSVSFCFMSKCWIHCTMSTLFNTKSWFIKVLRPNNWRLLRLKLNFLAKPCGKKLKKRIKLKMADIPSGFGHGQKLFFVGQDVIYLLPNWKMFIFTTCENMESLMSLWACSGFQNQTVRCFAEISGWAVFIFSNYVFPCWKFSLIKKKIKCG